MPRKGTNVEKIREILRLNQVLKFSIRQIAEATGVSKTSVGEHIAEYKRSRLSYRDVLDMKDQELAEIFEKRNKSTNPMYEDLSKEFPYYEKELARVGVTLFPLWEEYKERYPDGFSYSRFCHHYRIWESKLKAGMYIEHKAGNLIYADFTGKKMHYVDQDTGEVIPVEIFITILGAGKLGYVEAYELTKNYRKNIYYGWAKKEIVITVLKWAAFILLLVFAFNPETSYQILFEPHEEQINALINNLWPLLLFFCFIFIIFHGTWKNRKQL